MLKNIFISIVVTFAFGAIQTHAQQSRSLPEPSEQFRNAEALFALEKYAAARPVFEAVAASGPETDPLLKIRAAYYTALCAAELGHKDAEYLLEKFITDYSESSLRNMAWFRLGLLQFQKKNYRSALRSFEEVNIRALNNRELAEMYFKKGYCYLRQDDIQNAMQNFNQLRGTQTEFTIPATYYYAHLSYLAGDYNKALSDFEKIRNEHAYRNIIPLYIVHIHYNRGHYQEVVDEGVPMFTGESNMQNLEVARMLGDSYYRLGNSKEALKYLEFFHNNNRRQPNREESYQLGYLYYLNERWADAIRYFQPATTAIDSLAQYAYYHLAGAYMKTGHKQYAASAFNSAYRMIFNPAIREDALFNYAKLSLEISSNPYNEAIRALNQYLEDFPEGLRRQEALTYLVHLYMTTSNYREALASIETIRDKDHRLREAYQKITYYRGIELFNDRDYFNAVAMFKNSQESPVDATTNVNSFFWTGEAYYRLALYDLAASYFNRFLNASGARNLPLFFPAHYNLGYTHFQQKQYNDAIKSFNRFLANETRENKRMVTDAYLRVGDAHFISKSYQNAIAQYDKAIRMNAAEADYATFQKARAQGALGNQQGKIATLRAFEREFSTSPYAAEAHYELGNTALLLNQNAEALHAFNVLIRNYPASGFARIAKMKTGLVYYNTNEYNRSLDAFKKIVQDYPATPEAHEALTFIRNIYVEMNRVDEYFNYSRNLPFAQITDRVQDSLTYIAALNKYHENDCQSARTGFGNYLTRFPQGLYALHAHFYKADCEFRANNNNAALVHYETVIERPRSEFTERALQRAARINQNLNNHSRAREQFVKFEQIASTPANRIEAITGQLHTSRQLDDYQAVLVASDKLLNDERVLESSRAEIHLMAGKAAMILQQDSRATESFTHAIRLSPRGNFGAEASFHLASIRFKQKKYTEAESTIFDLAANYASYDYWVASGFILLADIYKENGNIFQARETLLSVIENYPGDDLKQLATQKLNELNTMGGN